MPQRSTKNLMELVGSLSPEQQGAVEAFIRYLHERHLAGSETDVRTALDEFVREHSELLRRLAE